MNAPTPPLPYAGHVPPVAVCIPLYRMQDYIADTIRSVLAQTFTDFELVVLDNASPDRSGEIARSFDDPRILVTRNSTTLPVHLNWTAAVRSARAPLVKLLSADDLLDAHCLERQVAQMHADHGLALVAGRFRLIDQAGRPLTRGRGLRTRDLVGRQDPGTVFRRVVRHGANPIGPSCSVMIRRAAFDGTGGFAGGRLRVTDLDLWVRSLEHGGYFGTDETVASYRVSATSLQAHIDRADYAQQRRFTKELARRHPTAVRRRDSAVGAVCAPLALLRHQVLFTGTAIAGWFRGGPRSSTVPDAEAGKAP